MNSYMLNRLKRGVKIRLIKCKCICLGLNNDCEGKIFTIDEVCICEEGNDVDIHLKEMGCTLTIDDDIELVKERLTYINLID